MERKIKIGIVDTMFSRVNMGAIAIDELRKNYPEVEIVRTTVPGIKDLPVACKQLLDREGCDVAMALGMVGGAAVDAQCAHEASLGIQQAKLLTNKHIIEVFVHENEAWHEKEFFEICNNRTRKHVHNAIDSVLHPERLIANAGKGIRQGKEDEGEIKLDRERPIVIGIVVAAFNREITEKMELVAIAHAKTLGVTVSSVITVPGAYDTPLAVKKLLLNKQVDAIAVLGAIVKGQTLHDEVIGAATTKALIDLSLEFNKPVTLGIIGPGASWEAAEARKEEYAKRAVEAAVTLVKKLRRP